MFKIINKIKEKITTRFSSKKTKNLLEKELKNDKISKEKNKIKKINKILKFSILPLVLFFPALALAETTMVEDFFLSLVWDILVWSSFKFMEWSGILFDNFLGLTLFTGFYNQDFIRVVWTSLRDFANVAFILSLVYIAVSIMLQDVFGVRKNLIKLIIIAFLINFSFFFTRLVIDAGNVTGLAFYDAIAIKNSSSVNGQRMLPFFQNNELLSGKSISGGVLSATGFKESINSSETFRILKTDQKSFSESMLIGLFYAIFFFAFARSFLIAAFGFVTRTIWLIIYIIFSPLAFVTYFLPNGLSKYFDQWLGGLLNRSFGIAGYLLMMYIIFKFIQMEVLQPGGALSFEDSATGDLIVLMLPLAVKGLIMWTLLGEANKLSVKLNENGSSLFAKAFEGASGMVMKAAPVGRFTKKVVGAGARTSIGGTASRILYNKDSKINQFLARQSAKGGLTGTLADAAYLGTKNVAEKATFGSGKSYAAATKESEKKNKEIIGLRNKALGDDGVTKLQAHENTHNTKVTGFADTEKGRRLEAETREKEKREAQKVYNEKTGDKDLDEKAKKANDELIKNEEKRALAIKKNEKILENKEKEIELMEKEMDVLEQDLKNAKTDSEKKKIEATINRIRIKKNSESRDLVNLEDEINDKNIEIEEEARDKKIEINTNASGDNLKVLSEAQVDKNISEARQNMLGNNIDETVQVSKGLGVVGMFTSAGAAARDVSVNEHGKIIGDRIKKEKKDSERKTAYAKLDTEANAAKNEIRDEINEEIENITKKYNHVVATDTAIINNNNKINKLEEENENILADIHKGNNVDDLVSKLEVLTDNKISISEKAKIQSNIDRMKGLGNSAEDLKEIAKIQETLANSVEKNTKLYKETIEEDIKVKTREIEEHKKAEVAVVKRSQKDQIATVDANVDFEKQEMKHKQEIDLKRQVTRETLRQTQGTRLETDKEGGVPDVNDTLI